VVTTLQERVAGRCQAILIGIDEERRVLCRCNHRRGHNRRDRRVAGRRRVRVVGRNGRNLIAPDVPWLTTRRTPAGSGFLNKHVEGDRDAAFAPAIRANIDRDRWRAGNCR